MPRVQVNETLLVIAEYRIAPPMEVVLKYVERFSIS